ncbi:chondroitinase-B domain-containing protein [Chitinophaga sp. 22620]|uniref:chondroitinase-B domain-containing protein n=1 Tax=Chitinophaga sp. 22620 TaxID=3453952 RepID=UPI003F86FDF8
MKKKLHLFLLLLIALKLPAAVIPVSSLPALQAAINNAVAGDVIVLANGVYTATADITVNKKGTKDKPITITAATIGGVEINGSGGFNLVSPASYVVIQGFNFTHNAGRAKTANGTTFCRFTRNIFENAGDGDNLTISGSDHEVDYNTFRHKDAMARFLAIRGSGSQIAQRLHIHHNYFYDHKPQGANGAESLQFGLSGLSMSLSNSIVEYNVFEALDGENEAISIKAGGIVIRYNTIRDCPGQLTLRHGNHCDVYGNYFLNTPGIRIFGDDHNVFSNHFENCNPAINIGNGAGEVADGAELTTHDRPDRVFIGFNTLADNPVNYVLASRTNGLGATSVSFVYNIIQGGGNAARISGPYPGAVWKGNILYNVPALGDMPEAGAVMANPLLARDITGTYHLQPGSPAIGAADSAYPAALNDMDGQPRLLPLDAGADEVSSAPVNARILTGAEVGHLAAANKPVAGISSPADKAILDGGTTLPVVAETVSLTDSIVRVDFYIDGVKAGEATEKPFIYNWQTVEGAHTIGVKAIGNSGGESDTSTISVTVNPAGTSVRITSPVDNAVLQTPLNLAIAVDANDTITGIRHVEFYNGNTLLGADSSSPYTFVWNNVTASAYTLQAKAVNNNGKTGISAPVKITVQTPSATSFDITDNGGAITGQYPNTTKPSEDVPALIDNNTSTKYYRSGRTALWVRYESVVPAIVVRYTITSGNDVAGRDPKDWQLQGSGDGSSWITLDTRSGEAFTGRRQTRSFTVANTAPYKYYRLNITANNGETGIQFSEWELFERKQQTVGLDSIGDLTYGDEPVVLNAFSTADLPVTLEVASGPATLQDSLLTVTGTGLVTIRAFQPGNGNFFPDDSTITITVHKAEQSVFFEEIGNKTYGDSAFRLNANVASQLPVHFSIIAGPAVLDSNLLTITGAGEVTVMAIQEGNENYLADSTEQTFTVNKAGQTITFPVIAPRIKYQTVTLEAAASSGLPVTYSLVAGSGVITGNRIRLTGEGITIVKATQAGNENLEEASAEQSILVLGAGLVKDPVEITVYPNPTPGPVRVRLDDKKNRPYTFRIIDRMGNQVATATIPLGQSTREISFDLSSRRDDLYFLHVSDGQGTTVRLIIKY